MATAITADQKFIANLGRNLLLTAVNEIVQSMFYGVYVVLFCTTMVVLLRKEGNTKARYGLLVATLTMFTLASFWFWSNTDLFLSIVKADLIDNTGVAYSAKHAAYVAKALSLNAAQQVIPPFMVCIGDAIVFWRAWVLCDVNRRIVIIPLVFLIGTIGCSFGFLGCYAANDWPTSTPPTCSRIQTAAFSLSIVTNITGTAVIGYRFWLYRQAVGKYLGEARLPTRIEKILVVLIETGAAYCLIWIVELVLIVMPHPKPLSGGIVQQIFQAACVQLMGIYPTLIIVLVYYSCSLWDTPEVSSGTRFSTTLPGSSAGSTAPSPEDFKSNSTLVGAKYPY